MPETALAFTSTDKVLGFMQSRAAGEWQIRLIGSNEQLFWLLAELNDQERDGVCVDCEPDGSGGTYYTLAEFRDSFRG